MHANLTAKGLMVFKKRNLIAPFEKQALEVDKLIRDCIVRVFDFAEKEEMKRRHEVRVVSNLGVLAGKFIEALKDDMPNDGRKYKLAIRYYGVFLTRLVNGEVLPEVEAVAYADVEWWAVK